MPPSMPPSSPSESPQPDAARLIADSHPQARQVLDHWFTQLTPKDWFRKSDALDAQLRERFAELLEQAQACELWEWRTTPGGRLAEILLLDQFARNIHRDTPRAFSGDNLALALSQQAVTLGDLEHLPIAWQPFAIMPWMHSESLRIHEYAEQLFARPGLEHTLRYEHLHADIVRRFGRYPHRNAILGRESTPDEVAFLGQPGSSF